MTASILTPRCALLSVADKSGLIDFARRLHAAGLTLLSTGGTAQTLRDHDIPVTDVSTHTGFPEIMGGRVKTLHPKIHGGILARRGEDDAVMKEHGITGIDLVVVNLYPFRETIAKEDVTLEEAIENIDIGGPTMVRAAAKNHADVGIVVDPTDYPRVLSAIEKNSFDLKLRRKLALKAFAHTAAYDGAISQYLQRTFNPDDADEDAFPTRLELSYTLVETLRYGENPHQRAAFYKSTRPVANSLASAKQHQGKALSYNNIADADAALATVLRLQEHAGCVIVKHANPCGAAIGENIHQAYDRAHRCDPTSAFGGIIAFNRGLDEETASEILSRQFVEVILAPAYSDAALEVLTQKPNIRVLQISSSGHQHDTRQLTSVRGGLLVQDWDSNGISKADLQVVSTREPSHNELDDLLFAWRIVQTSKSNAIVFAKDGATIGIGGGQTSRVYSAQIAAQKAADAGFSAQGAVLASDAFFPFRDGVDTAAQAGIRAIIQPGGSIRDEEVIQAADEHDIAMIFTGMRHFRH